MSCDLQFFILCVSSASSFFICTSVRRPKSASVALSRARIVLLFFLDQQARRHKMMCPSLLLVVLLSAFSAASRLGGARAFTPGTLFSSRPLLAARLRLGAGQRDDDERVVKDSADYRTNSDGGSEPENAKHNSLSRRLFASRLVGTAAAASIFMVPGTAIAGIDVSSLKNVPIEGDASGAAARLKQLQMQGTKVERGGDFTSTTATKRLDSGVSYREISAGREGARMVKRGSNIGAVITVRTPRGLKCYSTKVDNDANELAWTVGSGDFPRGLEEGMMGMKLNAVRRIEVPSQQIFAARNAGQLPEATTEDGKQCYETLFQSGDATLVFEVFVTGINQGDNRI